MKNLELKKMANEVRKGIVTAVHSAKAGHPGGSLSAADLYTYLYFEEMNVGPDMIGNPDRDRFVLSKGHTCPGLYAAMALRGFFPVEELPDTFPEFADCLGTCRYTKCTHTKEEGCAVLAKMAAGKIAPERHESYQAIRREILEKPEWQRQKESEHRGKR